MANNLEILRTELGLTKRDMANKLGVHEGNYGRMERGEINISAQTKINIAKAFPEYNLEWIVSNKGDRDKKEVRTKPIKYNGNDFAERLNKAREMDLLAMSPTFSPETTENSPFIDLGNGQYNMIVPLVEQAAQAGYASMGWQDVEYIAELPKHSIIVDKYHRGKYFAFRVYGSSMDDGTINSIPEGSIVTGREIKRELWRSKFHIHKFKYYVIVTNDGIVVKQITDHDVENGIITCHSLNDRYQDFDLNLDEINQILNVVDISIKTA